MLNPNDKWLISQPDLIEKLGLSRAKFYRLKESDPTFPRPLKDGNSRQAAAHYVVCEVVEWLECRISERDAA